MIKKFEIDLLNGNIWKSLLLFAIPLFISNVFQQLYNTVDTMIVGNILGDTSLAAMGACSAVYDLLIGFALGVGNGLSVVAARSYGSKDKKLLRKSVAGSIVIGLIISIVIMLVSQLFLFPLLQLLNTPQAIINESYAYISIVTVFVIVMFAYNLCAGILRAIGNSVIPLIFLVISSIFNIGFDVLFIVSFGLGVKGAAIGTVFSQGISVILCLIYIKCKSPLLIPNREDFKIDKDLYKELLGQGFSMGLMMSIVSIGTVILQSSINSLGYLTIAAHTAARKISAFAVMPCSTISASVSTFVSQNKGALQKDRIKSGIKYANLYSIIWGIFATLVMILFANDLVKLISGSNESIVLENGTKYLLLNAPFYAILGILLNLRHALQGIGKKVVPLVSSVIECVGKVLFVLLLIPYLKYIGIIICEPIIWCIMCSQLAYAFYKSDYINTK